MQRNFLFRNFFFFFIFQLLDINETFLMIVQPMCFSLQQQRRSPFSLSGSPNLKNQLSGSLEVAPRSRWDVSITCVQHNKSVFCSLLLSSLSLGYCRLSSEYSAIVRVGSVSSCQDERGRDPMRFWRKTSLSPFPIVMIIITITTTTITSRTTMHSEKWNSHNLLRHQVERKFFHFQISFPTNFQLIYRIFCKKINYFFSFDFFAFQAIYEVKSVPKKSKDFFKIRKRSKVTLVENTV